MPNLTFVLPHWLYWLGLILIPLSSMYLLRQTRGKEESGKVSLPIAYFLLITGGFIGMHRFYVGNKWGVVLIPLFLGILFSNVEARDSRNAVSLAKNEVLSAEFLLERVQKEVDSGSVESQQKIATQHAELTAAQTQLEAAVATKTRWDLASRSLGILILVILVLDIFLLPRLLAKNKARLEQARDTPAAIEVPCDVDVDGRREEEYIAGIHTPFVDVVNRLNDFVGRFVAYWSIIAVMVYYYEVIARYVFNSPTNWAHESMFLMFGMQYLLAGGYVLRYNGHVRVDVFYVKFSARHKAMIDIATSIFFFIFIGTLLWSGWTFFYDSFSINEVSFTEWAIQYWPIKMALPLGAALLLLQGVAWLAKDIVVVLQKQGN